jgi:predicted RNase H-like nuclease (RuvC/YqgF family)
MRDYNRGLIKQIDELTGENERLREENKNLRADNRELRTENARLRERIEDLETSIEERINKSVKEAVGKAVASLQATIAEKDKEILRLKSQIDKDSSNSSKPSGSNGFKKIPNNREKSGKKQGGQTGHKGVRMNYPAAGSGVSKPKVKTEVLRPKGRGIGPGEIKYS